MLVWHMKFIAKIKCNTFLPYISNRHLHFSFSGVSLGSHTGSYRRLVRNALCNLCLLGSIFLINLS